MSNEEGWVDWEGGECPVDENELVRVKFRNGEVDEDSASEYNWHHYWGTSDIVAYKVINGKPLESVTKDTNPKDSIGDKKVPLWLCSVIAKAHWALAQFAGLMKYGAWNWRKAGVRTSTYISALERHLEAYKNGEEYDPIDGTHHLGNIMACSAILLEARAIGKLTDDRPPKVEFRETFEEVQDAMAVLKEKYKDMNPRHYTIADSE